MKYLIVSLLSFPMALMAQSVANQKDTLPRNRPHYLVRDGHKYVFSYEQWLKMTELERTQFVTIADIQAALKRKGYYIVKIKNTWDKKTIKAFIKFQMDTGLPSFPHSRIDHFKALGLLD